MLLRTSYLLDAVDPPFPFPSFKEYITHSLKTRLLFVRSYIPSPSVTVSVGFHVGPRVEIKSTFCYP